MSKTLFLWQYLDIAQHELDNIKNLYLKILPTNNYFFQTVDIGITHFLGLELQKTVLIQVAPQAVGRIHTDFRPNKNLGDQLAIQIPLENCEHSITELWASDYKPPVQYTHNDQPYNYFDKSKCTKVSEFTLTQPVIWRTDVPHSVSNSSDNPRLAISLRFKKDPWHLI